jgi:hypothetical protein
LVDLRIVTICIALGAGIATFAACRGPEPGKISFSSTGGGSSAGKSDDSGDDDDDTTPAAGPVNSVFANELYPSIEATCSTCHLSGLSMAPIFFGDDAPATYALFKQKGYEKAGSKFGTKGAHLGPALTDEQKTLLQKWIDDEGGGAGGGAGGGGNEAGADGG